LIQIYWPSTRLKEHGPICKRHRKWMVGSTFSWKSLFSPPNFQSIPIRSLKFFCNSILLQKFIFIIFTPWFKRGERDCRIPLLREKFTFHAIFYHQNNCFRCPQVPCDVGVWWWLCRASMLPKKHIYVVDFISCFRPFFFVYGIDKLIFRCTNGVGKVFLGWNDLGIGLKGKKILPRLSSHHNGNQNLA